MEPVATSRSRGASLVLVPFPVPLRAAPRAWEVGGGVHRPPSLPPRGGGPPRRASPPNTKKKGRGPPNRGPQLGACRPLSAAAGERRSSWPFAPRDAIRDEKAPSLARRASCGAAVHELRTRGPNRGPECLDAAWLSRAPQARQAGGHWFEPSVVIPFHRKTLHVSVFCAVAWELAARLDLPTNRRRLASWRARSPGRATVGRSSPRSPARGPSRAGRGRRR